MINPSIGDVVALQARLGLQDVHVVWLGEEGFVIAHTDEERVRGYLEECPLHRWLTARAISPKRGWGYYTFENMSFRKLSP